MIKDVIEELRKFSDRLTEWYPPAKREDIEEVEQSLGVTLPEDFKEFLMVTNGFEMMCDMVFGIKNRQEDLYEVYRVEHNELYAKMPHHLIPFCPDGAGNHYCFDNNNDNVVVFIVINVSEEWCHDWFAFNKHTFLGNDITFQINNV